MSTPATTIRFTVAPGRTVVLPQDLGAGPGATNLRFQGGEVVDLAPAAARSRFVRNRVSLGDLVPDPAPTRATGVRATDRPASKE